MGAGGTSVRDSGVAACGASSHAAGCAGDDSSFRRSRPRIRAAMPRAATHTPSLKTNLMLMPFAPPDILYLPEPMSPHDENPDTQAMARDARGGRTEKLG